MRRLTVLMVGAFPFPLGQGSQVYAASQIRGLIRRGHRVVLVSYPGSGETVEGLIHRPTGRIPGATLASGPHWSRGPLDAWMIRRIRQVLREFPVDLIHAHNVEAPVLAAAARMGRRRPPILYDMHTEMASELPRYRRGGADVWSRLGRAADRWAVGSSDAGVAIGERAELHLSRWGLPVRRVGPGVDVDELRDADGAGFRRRWNLGSTPCVVYTGTVDAYQDLPVLYDAMDAVPGRLVIATTAPAARVRADAEARGLRDVVVVPGDWSTTRDAIDACEVAAIPRVECMGFPIKLLNFLGLGVPAVCAEGSAQDIPGVVSVPGGDRDALAAALTSLLRDQDRRQQLSEEAWNAVESGWSVDAAAQRLEAAYAEILNDLGCT